MAGDFFLLHSFVPHCLYAVRIKSSPIIKMNTKNIINYVFINFPLPSILLFLLFHHIFWMFMIPLLSMTKDAMNDEPDCYYVVIVRDKKWATTKTTTTSNERNKTSQRLTRDRRNQIKVLIFFFFFIFFFRFSCFTMSFCSIPVHRESVNATIYAHSW